MDYSKGDQWSSLGLGPHLFSPCSPSLNSRMSSQMEPINGIRTIRKNHPLFPTSCKRRTKTPSDGRNTARL